MDANLCKLSIAQESVYAEEAIVRQSGTFTLTGLPTAGQTVTVGDEVYTWRANVPNLITANDVLLGANAAACALNLAHAINGNTDKAGVTHAVGTTANERAFALIPTTGTLTVKAIYDGAPPGLVKATRVLTFTNQPANGDTVTIDGKTYTFQTILTNVDGNVFIGANLAASIVNLVAAIGLGAGSGVGYAAATVLHPTVEVSASDATTVTARAKTAGTIGNAIIVTEVCATASWAGGTLTGGTDNTIATTDTSSNAGWADVTLVGGSGTAPTFQEIRFTGEGLVPGKDTVVSEEIRSDRAIRQLIQVGLNCRGPVNVEMHLVGYDTLLLAALMAAAWTTEEFTEECDYDYEANTITSDTNFSATIAAARFVKVTFGGPGSANNGVKKIVSVVDNVMTLEAGALSSSNEGEELTFNVRYARVGTTLNSFKIQKEFLQHVPPLANVAVGLCVNQFDLSLDSKAIAKAVFTFLGAKMAASPGSYGNAAATAATGKPIMNTSANVAHILLGGSTPASPVMALKLSINNNLGERPQIGSLITAKPRTGSAAITGQVTTYFKDRTMIEDFLAHVTRGLEFSLRDSLGGVLGFYLPQVQFPNAQNLIGGINSDVVMPLDFQAVLDDGAGGTGTYMLQVDNLSV